MEPAGDPSSDHLFLDALDAFSPPDLTLDSDAASHPQSVRIRLQEDLPPLFPDSPPPPSSLRRRRPRERPTKILLSLKEEDELISDQQPEAAASNSTLTSEDHSVEPPTNEVVDFPAATESHSPPPERENESLLVSVATLLIKAILFQINLLITCFRFPIWLLHSSFSLATDPFGTLRRGRRAAIERFIWVWRALLESLISPIVYERLRNKGVGKLAVRLTLGCFWSAFVAVVLFSLLAMAFLAGSLLMRWVVEEPIKITQDLSFDYTKPSPDAFVPMVSHGGGAGCNFHWGEKGQVEETFPVGRRLIPPNHKLQLTISLTLPESDYNQKLGVFQIRAELLSSNGKATSTLSRPCMLCFKSSHIRFMETFLKSGILLTGYSSESQILSIRMNGINEGNEPTVCIRVILEQRAEYRPGAGIPEIYAASIKIESELPFLKRIVWNWRRTVFIWVGMGFFIFEILFALVCCRSVIFPRARRAGASPSRL